MGASLLERADVGVVLDPTSACWRVTVGSTDHTVREWSWGERWRLLDACTAGDRFDRHAFVDGLVRLLVRPVPVGEDVAVLAAVTLRLLGVDAGRRPLPLLAAEDVLIGAWGMGPADLDGQPARRLDQHLASFPSLPSPAVRGADDGWSSIVVVDA